MKLNKYLVLKFNILLIFGSENFFKMSNSWTNFHDPTFKVFCIKCFFMQIKRLFIIAMSEELSYSYVHKYTYIIWLSQFVMKVF